jgi:hypothetical protein
VHSIEGSDEGRAMPMPPGQYEFFDADEDDEPIEGLWILTLGESLSDICELFVMTARN